MPEHVVHDGIHLLLQAVQKITNAINEASNSRIGRPGVTH